MKTAEEILKDYIHYDGDNYQCVTHRDAVKAIEAYHAQFHPSEKTREGAIKIISEKLRKVKFGQGGKLNELTNSFALDISEFSIDALIESGHIQEPKDAEQAFMQYFEKWWKKEFNVPFGEGGDWDKLAKNSYKDGFKDGINSQVKPVDDRMREALKEAIETIKVWHNMGVPEPTASSSWNIYKQSPEMKRILSALNDSSPK